VLGSGLDEASPGMKEMAEFVSLVFANFRPRRGKPLVFGDEKLPTLTMPLMAVVGGRDVLLDSQRTQSRLAKSVPQADIKLIAEAGHLIRGQTSAILDFLNR
jgi:pimeloyl-ACP methyl ester carboxylesterase